MMLRDRKAVVTALLAYAGASLLHFAHNAEFLAGYPNMPGWLSRAGVYDAWLGVTAVGLLGFLLLRSGFGRLGLGVIAIYAVLGFDSLAHYWVAPFGAHDLAMHVTIWLEVATATVLLAVVMRSLTLRKGRLSAG